MNNYVGNRCKVALQKVNDYQPDRLKRIIDEMCGAAGIKVSSGSSVLLKPNLVSAAGGDYHLACSDPDFITAAAEWCLDHGARVKVGDSPAFGTAKMVIAACGITGRLKSLGVKTVNFGRYRAIDFPCGQKAPVSIESLDCDLLINLPRVKAHNQLYLSLAVKNYFGVVTGWRKALHHAVNGDISNRFEALLADIPGLFKNTFTILDGIVAMHRTGPMKGDPFPLGLVGAARDPVAMDSAIMKIIGAEYEKNRIWVECRRRRHTGTDLDSIEYPLLNPGDFSVSGFLLPVQLNQVTFHPGRMLVGACRRAASGILKR